MAKNAVGWTFVFLNATIKSRGVTQEGKIDVMTELPSMDNAFFSWTESRPRADASICVCRSSCPLNPHMASGEWMQVIPHPLQPSSSSYQVECSLLTIYKARYNRLSPSQIRAKSTSVHRDGLYCIGLRRPYRRKFYIFCHTRVLPGLDH